MKLVREISAVVQMTFEHNDLIEYINKGFIVANNNYRVELIENIILT